MTPKSNCCWKCINPRYDPDVICFDYECECHTKATTRGIHSGSPGSNKPASGSRLGGTGIIKRSWEEEFDERAKKTIAQPMDNYTGYGLTVFLDYPPHEKILDGKAVKSFIRETLASERAIWETQAAQECDRHAAAYQKELRARVENMKGLGRHRDDLIFKGAIDAVLALLDSDNNND